MGRPMVEILREQVTTPTLEDKAEEADDASWITVAASDAKTICMSLKALYHKEPETIRSWIDTLTYVAWKECVDAKGRSYYYNRSTKVSQWTRPTGVPVEQPDDA